MRKKKIALLFWFIVLATAICLGVIYIKEMSKYWFKDVEIPEYGLTISYPNSYIDIKKETDYTEGMIDKVTSILTKQDIDNPNISVYMVEKIIHAKSDITGMTIMVEAIKKEKTTKSIEDICKDYIVMFQVFNEYEEIIHQNYKETTVDGKAAGRTEIYVKGKTDDVFPGMVSYLIPLEDREITIVFTGTRQMLEYFEKDIQKIIDTVKFEEKIVDEEQPV